MSSQYEQLENDDLFTKFKVTVLFVSSSSPKQIIIIDYHFSNTLLNEWIEPSSKADPTRRFKFDQGNNQMLNDSLLWTPHHPPDGGGRRDMGKRWVVAESVRLFAFYTYGNRKSLFSISQSFFLGPFIFIELLSFRRAPLFLT